MIKTLVVDDNRLMREMLSHILASDTAIEIVGEAKDGLEAESKIIDLKPDVVLLDLVMPKLDGMGLARKIRYEMQDDSPAFIVISSASGEEIISRAFENGISYYYLKPFDGRQIIESIKTIYESRQQKKSEKNKERDLENQPKQAEAEAVAILLHMYGIGTKFRGYELLVQAILLVLERENCLEAISKEVYEVIAERFHTNYKNVERNIRYVVQKGFQTKGQKMPFELQYLKEREEKPTNMEFISAIAKYIRKN